MRITKYGHSCLLVEVEGVAILTDPGIWNSMPDAEIIDAIFITHEHQDHFDIAQIQKLVEKHPDVRVVTHEAVAKKLTEAGIECEVIEKGGTVNIKGISVQSFGKEHACVYGDISPCRNTGYLINGELFAPGDSLAEFPPQEVRILALPCGGPWMRFSDAIDYAKKVKPLVAFPIHDAMYVEEIRNDLIPRIIGGYLESDGIKFIDMPAGASEEF
jgi:L-ascorbate metabolism protein UlaG (beta-lactamase superfamily)